MKTRTRNFLEVLFCVSLGVLLYAALLPVVSKAGAEELRCFWAFGDSLTDGASQPVDTWADQLDDGGYATVKNAAQGGLRMTAVDIPDFIKRNKCGEAILWAGTNDAIQFVSTEEYQDALRGHLDELLAKGLTVWLGLPVVLPQYTPEIEASTHQKRQETLDVVLVEYPQVHVLDFPYDHTKTFDGLHPTHVSHFWIGAWFIQQVGL